MIKVGVADFGMNVWDGGFFDYEQRCKAVKSIGFDGIERLRAADASEAVYKAAMVKSLGMDFATCQATNDENTIKWTAAFGKEYVWGIVNKNGFDNYCRQVNSQINATNKYGIKVALHNHMDTLVETQKELIEFLNRCPESNLLLDVGHLSIADGGDPLYIVENYFDRISAIHLKEWNQTSATGEKYTDRGNFCELGGGNVEVKNEEVVKLLLKKGYDKWIFIEHDTHFNDPISDLKKSRDILKSWGV